MNEINEATNNLINQVLTPGLIKLVILILAGTAAFSKKNPLPIRLISAGVAIAMLAWLLAPYLS